MDVVEAPVSTGLILIRDKCGKRIKAGFDENTSRELVARLEKESSGNLRPMTIMKKPPGRYYRCAR